jgi:hypothetical protein
VLNRPIETFRVIRFLVAGLILIGTGSVSSLEADVPEKVHPYLAIVAQNVFRLRPEVRAEVLIREKNIRPAARPSIRAAGFTDVCGRSQVLLEISEQGKAVVRSVLAVGEHFMGIEAEEINVGSMWAKLRINGEFMEVTLSSAHTQPVDPSGLKLPRK